MVGCKGHLICKLKNEILLDFSPMKIVSNYIYGVDGNNRAPSGKMICMIADKQTGQIINTLPTDYSTSEVDKQKDIGGEFFGDYFYDFNNGKIIISNPSGIYFGKVTDKLFGMYTLLAYMRKFNIDTQ